MRSVTILLIILGGIPLFMNGQSRVLEQETVESSILKTKISYSVYLPSGYETSKRSYPVLYLLHGGGDDHTAWVQSGEVQFIADKCINQGTATPMIIVMPDSKQGKSRYFNGYKGEWLYEDFFFQEFIPYIEKTYRVKPDKRYRAVSGLSMGGRSAFVYALHHPEWFATCCPLSPGAGPWNRRKQGNSIRRVDLRKHRTAKYYCTITTTALFHWLKKYPKIRKMPCVFISTAATMMV